MITVGYRKDLLAGQLSTWLDHFRWIAALAVAIAHLRNILLPDAGHLAKWEVPLYFVTLFGTQAVVIFFVLSGLLVGGVVLRALEGGSFSAGKFGLDRATRLYAALVPAALLSIVLQWSTGAHGCQAPDGAWTVIGNLAFLQNFYVEPLCNNHPLWSLSSEAYFYLVGPVLILAVGHRSWRLGLLGVLLFTPALIFFRPSYATPLFGLFIWLLGMVPWFVRLRVPTWVAAILLSAVLLASRLHLVHSEVLEDTLIALSFTMLLCCNLSDARAPFPGAAKSLSAFSYSLYLVHMPIAQALGAKIGYQALPNGKVSSYLIYLLALITIASVAWLFGFLFESRTRALRAMAGRLFQRRSTIDAAPGDDSATSRATAP